VPERSLLAWLDDPSPVRGIRFLRDERWDLLTYDRLAGQVRGAARGLALAGVREDQRVALVLPSGPEFVASFFGALLAGAVPTPIAPPNAFGDAAAYRAHVTGILRAAAPAAVVTVAEHAPVVRDLAAVTGGPTTATFDELLAHGDRPPGQPQRRAGALGLLQFTSGSSGRPRGVRIPLQALEHNVNAIARWLEMTAADATASWLPVHHDMGLIGCVLTPVACGGDLWLMRPQDFVRSPRRYLRCFGEHGARLTAMPNFGLEHVARRVRPEDVAGLDLSEWRAVIVGAERVRADVIDRFCRLLAPAGFRSTAILPAYGLAEATLAVTGLPLREEWRTVAVRPESLAFGTAVHEDATEEPPAVRVVGCGRPLRGVAVSIEDEARRPLGDGRVGEIVVGGASVGAGYSAGGGAAAPTSFERGTLRTGDAGFLLDGQLFVLGRLGDSVKIRGRSLFAEELESALLDAGIPSRHLAVVLGVRAGVPTGIALFDRSDESWQRQARAILGRRMEGGDVIVARVPVGAIIRTSSGKPRRRQLWQQFCEGRLATEPAVGR
jgi:acyl-CoA synthetase (AMP-forming)/AMP-acid ligase II